MPSEVASARHLWSLTFCLCQARGLCANWTCSTWPSVNPVSLSLQFGLTLLWYRVPNPEMKGHWHLCLWQGHHGPGARNAPSQPGSRSPLSSFCKSSGWEGFTSPHPAAGCSHSFSLPFLGPLTADCLSPVSLGTSRRPYAQEPSSL